MSPTATKPEDLWSLFKFVLVLKDSSKVGDLDKYELGMLNFGVRSLQDISLTATTIGEKEIGDWLQARSQIILKTSNSKGGRFLDRFITAKRFSSKEKLMGIPGGVLEEPKKKSFWNRIRGR